MANTGRLGRVDYEKETTWGVAATSAMKNLRVTSESLTRAIEHVEDGQLIGEIYTTDMVKVADGATGGFEITAHPEEVGPLFYFSLGKQETPGSPSAGYLRVNYTGSENYASLQIASGIMTAKVGADAAAAIADVNFNTTGSIDFSDLSFDTLTEVATAIQGYTGWTAQEFGSGAASMASVADQSETPLKEDAQLQGSFITPIPVTSTESAVHKITPAQATDDMPSFSLKINRTLGTDKSYVFTGCKVNTLAINMTAKDLVKLSLGLSVKEELNDQTDQSGTINDLQGYISPRTDVYYNEINVDEVKDSVINVNNNLDESNVVGDFLKIEQIRNGGTIEQSGTLNLTTGSDGSYQFYSFYVNDTPIEQVYYIESPFYADQTNNVKYSVLIKLNKVKLTDFNSPLSTPDRLTISEAGMAVKSKYYKHIEIYVVDQETGSY